MARMKVKLHVGLGLKQRFREFTLEYHAFHVVTFKELDKQSFCS